MQLIHHHNLQHTRLPASKTSNYIGRPFSVSLKIVRIIATSHRKCHNHANHTGPSLALHSSGGIFQGLQETVDRSDCSSQISVQGHAKLRTQSQSILYFLGQVHNGYIYATHPVMSHRCISSSRNASPTAVSDLRR